MGLLKKIHGRRLLALATAIFLAACFSTGPQSRAPVSDINRAPAKLSGTHVVKSNETLFTIAWRYNRDFKELAQVNDIKPPYTIRPGQTLSLAQSQPKAKPRSTTQAQKAPQAKPKAPDTVENATIQWHWPASGTIIHKFLAQNGKNGIDIAGKQGQAVKATAAGDVVYSGSGLRGYGQLIIIKHNDEFLSAYAHNSKLLVKEGEKVKALQKIAEMGETDTESVRLHFEIRRHGKPVDPLAFLPKAS